MVIEVRTKTYEDTNQSQHAILIIRAIDWLKENHTKVDCYWHPLQTREYDEPDLRAKIDKKIILSAAITISEKLVGSIDKRMSDTLIKLSKLEAIFYYFVQTDAMANRANSTIQKIGTK